MNADYVDSYIWAVRRMHRPRRRWLPWQQPVCRCGEPLAGEQCRNLAAALKAITRIAS